VFAFTFIGKDRELPTTQAPVYDEEANRKGRRGGDLELAAQEEEETETRIPSEMNIRCALFLL